MSIPYGMFALPNPSSEQSFFLIHSTTDVVNGSLQWPEIQFSKVVEADSDSTGRVAYKNLPLFQADYAIFANAIKHANGRDWWIIGADFNGKRFHRALVKPDTVEVLSTQVYDANVPVDSFFNLHGTVFSPDGSELLVHDSKGIRRYDFDRCTGMLSNESLITFPGVTPTAGSVSYSPNRRFLYYSQWWGRNLYQLDLENLTDPVSPDTLAIWDGLYDPAPPIEVSYGRTYWAPDGKIYLLTTTTYAHYIARPNFKGQACRFFDQSIRLPAFGAVAKPYYPNYRLGPIDGSTCDTLGINNEPLADFSWLSDSLSLTVDFTDNSFYEPALWSWDFGDGQGVSQDTNPTYTFPSPGVYTVCLTVSNANASDEQCYEVTVGTVSAQNPASPGHMARVDVFPNPASSAFYVKYSSSYGSNQPADFRLFNTTGQCVLERTVTGRGEIDLIRSETLPGGVYYWTVQDGVETVSGKIVLK
ncbi:MAG: PKD domain-containing protein [Saprospiraceae bacterium]|nr:PKD domain-containing protein [Saprospiraceae bacterium]